MVKRGVKSTFPPGLTKEPIIYKPGQQFRILTDIRRADVNGDKDWVVLELGGQEEDIERGIAWVTDKGVRVDPAVGDIVEG
jgi:NIL domain